MSIPKKTFYDYIDLKKYYLKHSKLGFTKSKAEDLLSTLLFDEIGYGEVMNGIVLEINNDYPHEYEGDLAKVFEELFEMLKEDQPGQNEFLIRMWW